MINNIPKGVVVKKDGVLVARSLLPLTDVEAFTFLTDVGVVNVEFDDGVIETNGAAVYFSFLSWGLAKAFKSTPLKKAYLHRDNKVTERSDLILKERILFDTKDIYSKEIDAYVAQMRANGASEAEVYEVNHVKRIAFFERLAEVVSDDVQRMYNASVQSLGSYAPSLCAVDFIQIRNLPKVKEANANIVDNYNSIDEAHRIIANELQRESTLPNNSIANIARSGIVSSKQILQLFSAMGYRTEASNQIFPKPILTSLYEGLRDSHDYLIETRSAAKALYNNKEQLPDTEYMNRKLQLICGYLHGVIFDDCGNTETYEFEIKDVTDLNNIKGVWIKSSVEGKKWDIVNGITDRNLVGSKVHIRSSGRCKLKSRQHICSACMGELADTIPLDVSLGHVSALETGAPPAQLVLSTKHFDGNAKFNTIIINEDSKTLLKPSDNESSISLLDRLRGKNIRLTVFIEQFDGLAKMAHSSNLRTSSVHNYSQLTSVALGIDSNRGYVDHLIELKQHMDERTVSLSFDVLEFIKAELNKGNSSVVTTNDNQTYTIDLGTWGSDRPLFVLSRNHSNVVEFLKNFSSMVIGDKTGDKIKDKGILSVSRFEKPEDAMVAVYRLMRTKLNVNIKHIENILIALSVSSVNERTDNEIAKGQPDMKIGRFSYLIANRSITSLVAYQGTKDVLENPATFLIDTRLPHFMDNLFVRE